LNEGWGSPKLGLRSSRIKENTLAATVLVLAGLGSGYAQEEKALLEAPVSPVPPLFDQAAIDTALAALDGIVEQAMDSTGLPGAAVGVVYKDEVVYAKGFGVREIGKPGAIDADTVFMLASVSKPIASTVVAFIRSFSALCFGMVKRPGSCSQLSPAISTIAEPTKPSLVFLEPGYRLDHPARRRY
jgi:Beta-lactamase